MPTSGAGRGQTRSAPLVDWTAEAPGDLIQLDTLDIRLVAQPHLTSNSPLALSCPAGTGPGHSSSRLATVLIQAPRCRRTGQPDPH